MKCFKLIVALASVGVLSGGFAAAAPSTATARATAPRQTVAWTGPVWASVAAGVADTCGIRLDRTLWCWSWNDNGQLGLGDTRDRNTPTQVGGAHDWAFLQVGDFHTCGIRLDHTLWCWGSNHNGQLGLGDTSNRLTPTQVEGGKALVSSLLTGAS